MATYTVVSGDTLSAIAGDHGMTLAALLELNPGITNPNLIHPGDSIITSGDGSDGTDGTDDVDGPEAIPEGARLVRAGSEYRVLWDLPEGLGTVWYSINTDQLVNIYGDDWESSVVETYANVGAYDAKYGDLAWGNIAEIGRTAEDPWQDMYDRITQAFGFVSGMDEPEVRELVIQAYFEQWTPSEFLALYKDTDYYHSTTDIMRTWEGISDAEKDRRIRARAVLMVEYYQTEFGVEPDSSMDNASIMHYAEAIESGTFDWGEWKYTVTNEAEKVDGTPAAKKLFENQIAAGEPEVSAENLGAYAANEWSKWLGGSVPIPDGWIAQWGNWLYMNEKSEADLENYLKGISSTYYPDKDSETSWADWAAIPKSYIQNILELPTVEDSDALLDDILTSGLSGRDMRSAIKHDSRYLKTKGALSEFSGRVHNLGTMMGFIPGGEI